MQPHYNHQQIEAQAQHFWDEEQSFHASENPDQDKFYCLSMFPYPSGHLHMGHVRNYSLGDVIARYQRMLGKNVLQPMGWDAFGLPAENAAIKHKVHPSKWTYSNIDTMRAQFKRLGFAYDWQREIATCDPQYYRWEQWLFTRLFNKGLVYKKNAIVNWDPVDQTVLANEQVVDGCGWRSGAPVEQREIPQWFLRITQYADELLADLELLDQWPEQVRTMQKNWLGRSEGTNVLFKVPEQHAELEVFTTRPDTLFGVTYLAIAPQHPLAKQAAKNNETIQDFISQETQHKVAEAELATMEKKGIDTGFTATHPLSGESLPIWIANFVLMDYGSGAVMAVPGHDVRDHEFATQYKLPIKQVIQNTDIQDQANSGNGTLIHSQQFDGLKSEQAKIEITQYLEQQELGQSKIQYRLRDWGISRQRYWGAPIPIIHCPDCGAVPVPAGDLPVSLPENIEFHGANSSLKNINEFINVRCPKCGNPAKRETDTFDTFMESSWYYLRYTCPENDSAMLDEQANYWAPVDQYVGGIEHAVMHLLYARFFHKLLRDEGLVSSDEPFTRLLTQGMVLKDGSKMSKSKGNTVDPQALIEQYGADTVRLFSIFAAPPEQSLEWSDSGVEGANRFLKRLWSYAYENQNLIKSLNPKPQYDFATADQQQKDLRQELHQILQQAYFDYERLQLNTVVSAGMKIFNLLTKIPKESNSKIDHATIHEAMSILLRLLAPIVPHITHVLWQILNFSGNIIDAEFPQVDMKAVAADSIKYVVQINGKRRAEINIAATATKDDIEQQVLSDETVNHYIDGQEIKRFIIVPKKLINIVL